MHTRLSRRSTSNVRQRVYAALKSFFEVAEKSTAHPLERRIMQAIKEYTLRPGAKRTRGMLVVLGFLSNRRNKITRDILTMAAAYEVLHAYLLIHDDIIDDDVMRRGGPTLHKVFESFAPQALSRYGREKIGRDLSIIAGDMVADLVQRCLFSTHFSTKQKISALEAIERTLQTTYLGQVLDILALPQKVPPFRQQILRYQLKTAVYTIEAPFMLGASLGRARINGKKFNEFARQAGVAFQLSDDLQNVFSQGLAGRSSDIRSGKITLLVSFALQSRRHRYLLLRLLSKKKKAVRDIAKVKELLVKSGGYERARRYAIDSFRRASVLLDQLEIPRLVKMEFQALVQKINIGNNNKST